MRTITAVAIAALLTGCNVRLETSPPAELPPTTNELARQAMVNDLVMVQQAAVEAEQVSQADLAEVLREIAVRASAREDYLGGVYESGLPHAEEPLIDDEPSSGSVDTSENPVDQPLTAEETVTRLLDSAGRVRTSLDLSEDGDLARLIASNGIAHVLEAKTLARSAGAKFSLPDTLKSQEWTQESPLLSDEQLLALVASEDYAGYAYEVAAAMTVPDKRDALVNAAQTHRKTAKGYAILGGFENTKNDPRRSVYKLPLSLDADKYVASQNELRTVLSDIEESLAANYLILLSSVPAQSRAPLFDAALRSALYAQSRGADVDALFPFVEELTKDVVPEAAQD